MQPRVRSEIAATAGAAGRNRSRIDFRSSIFPAVAWKLRRAWPPTSRATKADSRLKIRNTPDQAATAPGRSLVKRNPANAASVGEKLGIDESPAGQLSSYT